MFSILSLQAKYKSPSLNTYLQYLAQLNQLLNGESERTQNSHLGMSLDMKFIVAAKILDPAIFARFIESKLSVSFGLCQYLQAVQPIDEPLWHFSRVFLCFIKRKIPFPTVRLLQFVTFAPNIKSFLQSFCKGQLMLSN